MKLLHRLRRSPTHGSERLPRGVSLKLAPFGPVILLLLSGCAHRPVTNGAAIPQGCIKAVYVLRPEAQCKPSGKGDLLCKDFAVLAKDIECWRVKQ